MRPFSQIVLFFVIMSSFVQMPYANVIPFSSQMKPPHPYVSHVTRTKLIGSELAGKSVGRIDGIVFIQEVTESLRLMYLDYFRFYSAVSEPYRRIIDNVSKASNVSTIFKNANSDVLRRGLKLYPNAYDETLEFLKYSIKLIDLYIEGPFYAGANIVNLSIIFDSDISSDITHGSMFRDLAHEDHLRLPKIHGTWKEIVDNYKISIEAIPTLLGILREKKQQLEVTGQVSAEDLQELDYIFGDQKEQANIDKISEKIVDLHYQVNSLNRRNWKSSLELILGKTKFPSPSNDEMFRLFRELKTAFHITSSNYLNLLNGLNKIKADAKKMTPEAALSHWFSKNSMAAESNYILARDIFSAVTDLFVAANSNPQLLKLLESTAPDPLLWLADLQSASEFILLDWHNFRNQLNNFDRLKSSLIKNDGKLDQSVIDRIINVRSDSIKKSLLEFDRAFQLFQSKGNFCEVLLLSKQIKHR